MNVQSVPAGVVRCAFDAAVKRSPIFRTVGDAASKSASAPPRTSWSGVVPGKDSTRVPCFSALRVAVEWLME